MVVISESGEKNELHAELMKQKKVNVFVVVVGGREKKPHSLWHRQLFYQQWMVVGSLTYSRYRLKTKYKKKKKNATKKRTMMMIERKKRRRRRRQCEFNSHWVVSIILLFSLE